MDINKRTILLGVIIAGIFALTFIYFVIGNLNGSFDICQNETVVIIKKHDKKYSEDEYRIVLEHENGNIEEWSAPVDLFYVVVEKENFHMCFQKGLFGNIRGIRKIDKHS